MPDRDQHKAVRKPLGAGRLPSLKRRVTVQEFVEHAYGQSWAQEPGPEFTPPPVSGESYRGPARLTEVNGEPVVEVLPDETGVHFKLLEERTPAGQPAYMGLAALSQAACPGDDLGKPALAACYSPSAEAQEEVLRFVQHVGLLDWGMVPHDCYEEQNKVSVLLPDGTPAISEGKQLEVSRFSLAHYELARGPWAQAEELPRRYGNAVAWILQEALIFRRAMALWTALRRLRLRGDMGGLDQLWGRRRGAVPDLFGEWGDYLEPNTRWETILRLSVGELWGLMNSHIRYATPVAEFVRSKWRRGRRTVDSIWFRPAIHFAGPLTGLWLQFHNDVMRGGEGGRYCQECGEPFVPKRVDQEFCCGKCGNRYRQRQYDLRQRLGEKEAKT